MNAVPNDASAEKLQAEQLVAEIPLIPEVEGVDVELYTDNTGDPAFQLVIRVRPDVEVDRKFIERFNEFAGKMQVKILHSGLHRFPYTRIKQVA